MQRNMGALGGGALATGLVLATGCLGTKLLVLLGISSGVLGGLSALEPYRPLLLVLGAGAFAVGIWRIAAKRRPALWRMPTARVGADRGIDDG